MGINVHYFDTVLAADFSVNEAIFMQNVLYWCYVNQCNDRNFSDGRYWTRNTNAALTKIFPYWSKNQIETVISNCKKHGLLLVQIENQKKMDRTRSFAPTDLAKSYVQNSEIHFGKSRNGNLEYPKCIYKEENNKPDNKQARLPYEDQMGIAAAAMVEEFVEQDETLREAFDGFYQMRKKKKQPLQTLRAVKLLIGKIRTLGGDDPARMARILDQSTERSWTGVFQLDEDKYQRGNWSPQAGGAEIVEQEDYSYGNE